MKKQYRLAGFGQRLILDWRKKRRQQLEKLLEQQEKNEWVGKKLDFFAGLILTWVLALVFLNHFLNMQFSLYLSVLGPIAFSWVYHLGKVNKQRLIAGMKREREQKAVCLNNLRSLQPPETEKLTVQLGCMLELTDLTVLGEELPVTGLKDEKKIALYLNCCHDKEEVSLQEIKDFIELTKNQGAVGGVYFTTGLIANDAGRYLKSLSNFKVKLVERDKLVQILKSMQHPLYLEKLVRQEAEKVDQFEQLELERKKLLQLFTEKPGMSQKYLVISVILGILSLIMAGWLKTFYLLLALVNLLLAFYTYYRHLPIPDEEKAIVEDLW